MHTAVSAPFQLDHLLRSYRFNLDYAYQLVEDVPETRMYRSLGDGLENHPAFVLGHLAVASAMIVEDLGGEYDIPDVWDLLFRRTGPGDPRCPDENPLDAPSKYELLDELDRQHRRVEQGIGRTSVDALDAPVEWRFDSRFPTLHDLLGFMCITHEAMHLGQLAAWRRAAGLESALARM